MYTWQNPDWDITKEKRDPSKGPLRWGRDTWEKLKPLYKKLEEKVGTLDFVWCYPAYKHWIKTKMSRLWVLKVPSSKIFHVLDSEIWDTMADAVLNDRQPEHISWDKLIVERSEGIKRLSAGNNDDITPLVLVPLCTSIQVIDRSRFNKGPKHSNAKYEDLPTSECEAERCRDEGYKRGAWRQRRRGRNSLS
ncbi:MAG: hypothetical protein ACYS83_10195 [Planctomycetota bacterium]